MKILYRYEIQYRSDDGFTHIRLRELPVIRETNYTYFIKNPSFYMKEKRVLKNARNTYAFDDKEKAKKHFIRRTNTRIKWFQFWIEECKTGLALIEDDNLVPTVW